MNSRTQYTRERLAEAAGKCANLDEVIAFFGAHPYGSLRRYLIGRFARFGIDTSHFHPRGRRPRPTGDELRAAVADSTSLAEVLRRLDLPDNGGRRAHLRTWIAEHHISTSHFLGQGHRRGKPGTTKRPEEVLVKHNSARRTTTKTLRRALFKVGVTEECSLCGLGSQWRGKPLTLEIDHISGDWRDDRRENLRLLCPNCHATTSTWCRGGRRTINRAQ